MVHLKIGMNCCFQFVVSEWQSPIGVIEISFFHSYQYFSHTYVVIINKCCSNVYLSHVIYK